MSASSDQGLLSTQDYPPDESRRLEALDRYNILDSPPEEQFDRAARLAARWLDVPISLVTLLAEDRQWFKACVGIEQRETKRDVAFCRYNIDDTDMLVVEDASEDPRFKENPLVTGSPGIRFYAGAPLVTPGGQIVGSLCAIDTKPRSAETMDLSLLEDLAAFVVDELELRLANRKIQNLTRSLIRAEESERGRLSNLLHEELQQILHASRMQVDNFPDTEALTPKQSKRLDRLDEYLSEAISTTRGLSARFAPPVGNQSLRDSLDWLTRKMEEHHELSVAVESDGAFDVYDETLKVLLFRVVRELLFNVVKHAGTREAQVTLEETDARFRVVVEDGGSGFNPENQPESVLGLAGARDRIEALDGTFQVSTALGEGTRISIEIPQEENSHRGMFA